jgi:predicted nucleotidyltransferase component of viral defense system
MNRQFSSPVSFRQSLENRLQTISKETGIDLQRVRRKVAFERFLSRLFSTKPSPWVLKGGYALEVRFGTSRATKDLDLGTRLKIAGTSEEQLKVLLGMLRERALLEMNDYFLFRVEPSAKIIESAPYGGYRFPIKSLVAGRLFIAFSLDIGFGDAVTPPVEEIEGTDWLDIYGIPRSKMEAISLEQQFAEKVHAMMVERGDRENSRIKDLVDILLLIQSGLRQELLKQCIKNTFHRRDDTPLSQQSPKPPENWRHSFSQMAKECRLNPDFDQAVSQLDSYWNKLWSAELTSSSLE